MLTEQILIWTMVTNAFSQGWIKGHSHKFEGKGCTAPPPSPPTPKPPALLRVGVNGSNHSQKYSVLTYLGRPVDISTQKEVHVQLYI
jgi:hypothetical protein